MAQVRDLSVDDLSDESSFYGDDDDEVKDLEHLVTSYDTGYYWTRIHPYSLSTIRQKALRARHTAKTEQREASGKAALMNPGTIIKKEDGDDGAAPPRRYSFPPPDSPTRTTEPKNEEADGDTVMTDVSASECSRVRRTASREVATGLTPSSTPADAVGPWIYVAAPQPRSGPQQAELARLVAEGTRALHRFENDRAALQVQRDRAPAGSKQAATRALLRRRQELESELFALARQTGVVSGKWMLFITADRVDEYWTVVAEATVRGELGFGAKVATDDGQGRARLIAIYTHDHEDREDVARVLRRMVELELVKAKEKPIYYKCDAFTHLEIMGNNPWGLKASRFSSRDVLRGEL
ncbi:DUF1917-domain-containing protein [Aspergillus indologenus CBS 114.80]|uniref:DUF1917-domain-containing protein n=1 Tax=Aspergillus indologenus CBS 114.80 TaxID=1450541 RepID=A0A2V5IA12_9EURO|nr:DUF1917-domain-containing protein [Aspergillus indologenus CBS 114.80]